MIEVVSNAVLPGPLPDVLVSSTFDAEATSLSQTFCVVAKPNGPLAKTQKNLQLFWLFSVVCVFMKLKVYKVGKR